MAEHRLSDEEVESEIAAARRRGTEAAHTEPRAKTARYDAGTGRIVIELTNGCRFEFPAEFGQGLRGATPEQLSDIEVLPGGSGLHWEALDADLWVPGLVAGIFGSKRWMAELGRRGGRSTSAAKARAARENGKKGGRPRKKATG